MFRLCIALTLVFFATVSTAETTLRALTSSALTPFSRELDSEMPGFAVELVDAIVQEAGYSLEVEDMPWSDAQQRAAEGEGYLLFGATRTASREDKYDWVTNLMTVRRMFMTIRTPVESMDAARDLGEIGATSVYFRALQEEGFTNVTEMSYLGSLEQLMSGNIDAVFSVAERVVYLWTRDLQLNFDLLTFSDQHGTSDIWLAASPGYDRDIMRALDAAAARVKANGTYERIWQSYFGAMEVLKPAWPEKRPTYEAGAS